MKLCSCTEREFFLSKASFFQNGLTHIISFMPGFLCELWVKDRRDGRNHGRGAVGVLFLVKGEEGAITLTINSGWYTDLTQVDSCSLYADLGIHSLIPLYEGQNQRGSCIWVDNQVCYFDCSSSYGEEGFKILRTEGETALWKFLESRYRAVFDKNLEKGGERR